MATNEDMKHEFEMFGDIWKFFKSNYEVKEDENYWRNVFIEANALQKKYNCELGNIFVQAIVDELDRKYRNVESN